MNQLLQSSGSDPGWQELRPVLDEAMHDLSADDREAVLLRFFEQRSLAEIGTRLGLTEDTARKRVARAVDKLRAGLAKRGITSTVAALSVALAERTVSAAPSGLAGQVSRAAVAEAAASGGPIVLLWKLLAGTGAVATAAGLLVLPGILHQDRQAASSMPGVAAVPPAASAAAASVSSSTPASAPALTAAQSSDTTNKLVLHIVAADSGKPIPSVTLDYWLFIGKNVKHLKPLTASVLGICEVPVPRATVTQLTLVSQRDGFADTRLQWHVDRGETIPQEYTLRLARAVAIGGTVVDADGNAVAGAHLGFGNIVDPSADLAVESSDFGWPFHIEAMTDDQGRWQMSRVTRETLRTLVGEATHPLHVLVIFQAGDSELQKRLLAVNYEFKMGRAVTASGTVVDNNGNPIPNAHITVGPVGMNTSRATNSGSDGQFYVVGCKPGKTLLSAEAKGYAPTTLDVDLGDGTGPFRLTLKGGSILLTDSQGRFTLKPDDSVTGAIAASAEGYAEATKAALAGEPAMVVQPWGRLEGTLQAQGRPGTNCALFFQLGIGELRGVSTDFTAYQTKTDGACHFVFEKVPPGKHQLTRLVEVTLTSGAAPRTRMLQALTNVDIRPGETTTVTVDGVRPGIPVP